MLKILVVDDHELVREGYRAVLKELDGDVVVPEAGNLEQALTQIRSDDLIDLVLLDLTLPDTGGLDGLKAIKKLVPSMPVAIVSALRDQSLVRNALEDGADGFIPKSSGKTVLLSAIRVILDGETFLPSLLLDTIPRQPAVQEEDILADRLTRRQLEVLFFMEKGLSNKEIAREIGCVESTVKAHVSAILSELDVNTRTRAIAAARECREQAGQPG